MTDDAAINYRFIDTYRGGHYEPKAYYAVLYRMRMEDVNNIVEDYDSLVSLLSEDPGRLDRLYAFSYDEYGLHDITDEVRKKLSNGLP